MSIERGGERERREPLPRHHQTPHQLDIFEVKLHHDRTLHRTDRNIQLGKVQDLKRCQTLHRTDLSIQLGKAPPCKPVSITQHPLLGASPFNFETERIHISNKLRRLNTQSPEKLTPYRWRNNSQFVHESGVCPRFLGIRVPLARHEHFQSSNPSLGMVVKEQGKVNTKKGIYQFKNNIISIMNLNIPFIHNKLLRSLKKIIGEMPLLAFKGS